MNRAPFRFRQAALVIRVALRHWQDDNAPRMGAALAYYIALSLGPAVLILLSVMAWGFGSRSAASRFWPQIEALVGYEGAHAIRSMIDGPRHTSGGSLATLFGIAAVMLASSAAVSELRDAMDTIWKVPVDDGCSVARTVLNGLKDRIFCLVLVAASGLYLVLSLIADQWIFAAGRFLNSGSALPVALVEFTDWAVSFAVTAVLFAFIFKVLPRVPVRWSDVAIGAVGTALLFSAGKFFLGLYLAKAGFAGTYGAAGSLVIVLVWVYYSAQLVYLGAEFSQAYARLYGSRLADKTVASLH